MPQFNINVIIENKPTIRDPEGEVIMRDLMVKNGYTQIKGVRTAKLLKIVVEASSSQEAKQIVSKMCDELRIYNPVVSICSIEETGA
ncbi:MAG: phosphoribosylformylglycinamidine synthase subunit PurS [Nitrososphaerales archaeon]